MKKHYSHLKEFVLYNFYQPFPDWVFESAHIEGVRLALHWWLRSNPPHLKISNDQ